MHLRSLRDWTGIGSGPIKVSIKCVCTSNLCLCLYPTVAQHGVCVGGNGDEGKPPMCNFIPLLFKLQAVGGQASPKIAIREIKDHLCLFNQWEIAYV